ncbi:hypothetical protein GQ651_14370 [Alphaproteobacteria bacterium GH1-50]|uniref:Uncharacterized protein n=1 Tax=Kangsaoukella pontilimi TaxID=2691042 RepID=A0A7C9II08_9RHOB|nr:hypothetical protein [Kangsaoukella pontilimi]MXQ09029.1 hypothetical protein [Kangsaoukella pontilimi]
MASGEISPFFQNEQKNGAVGANHPATNCDGILQSPIGLIFVMDDENCEIISIDCGLLCVQMMFVFRSCDFALRRCLFGQWSENRAFNVYEYWPATAG